MSDDISRIWKLMEDLDSCMLVTQPADGLRARPMSTVVDVDNRALHILAAKSGRVDDDIAANPSVLLTFSNGTSTHLSVTATAEVSNDKYLIESLWNAGAQAFWPRGPHEEQVVALILEPIAAEAWEGPGRVVSAVKFAVALATGTQPELGSATKVRM